MGSKKQLPCKPVIQKLQYDARCQLLSLKVALHNTSHHSIFIIVNEFVFLHGESGSSPHQLKAYKGRNNLFTLDVSKSIPTQRGLAYYRMGGIFGEIPDIWEIPPGHIRYITYVFQFPLELDWKVSKIQKIEAPTGKTKIRLCLGYANESFDAFRRRMAPIQDRVTSWNNLAIMKWHKLIVTQWQTTTFTDPVVFTFPTPLSGNPR
jgi:hypothetical protein